MTYDTLLFIEIIESIQGVQFLRDEEYHGIRVKVYQGLIGKVVRIDITEEDITEFVGRGHLRLLGLDHLGDALFPADRSFVEDQEVKTNAGN